ncbi:hypothetical protein SCHPADRAFT_947352 [Schizopora paradoxa]|uniref:Uncharacterized protein n=1 Tax=Schizopora paradoxa TaxID=27342 RepID=A0A0H2QZT6_9AGAM|nr:hypothetical protein SCHPADRAFT_947352 [Schizopora paradoxa]
MAVMLIDAPSLLHWYYRPAFVLAPNPYRPFTRKALSGAVRSLPTTAVCIRVFDCSGSATTIPGSRLYHRVPRSSKYW